MMIRSFTCAMAALLCSGTIQAQFSSSIKVLKRDHIVGEPVIVRVTMTNYTGQEQVLQGQRMPWISFMVQNSNGSPVLARPVQTPGAVKIEAGQTLARDFNLSQLFQLNEAGNYSVSAFIRPSNEKVEGTSTHRVQFQLTEGRPYWSQKVGDVGPDSTTRDFRILQFRGDKSTQLFVQIRDENTGQIVMTSPLGDVLMLRKPSMTIDGDRHLNVLFLTNPTTYLHYRISPSGEIVTRDMHRRAGTGEPRLTIMEQGIVIVTNSILFDPALEAEKRAQIRNITDRP